MGAHTHQHAPEMFDDQPFFRNHVRYAHGEHDLSEQASLDYIAWLHDESHGEG